MIGFQSKIAAVVTTDGHHFTFADPILYLAKSGVTYIIPRGATTDGASTPSALWNVVPPFGAYWLAAALHDAAYRNVLQLLGGALANLSREQCDNLLLEAMQTLGVDEADCKAIFDGVRLFGHNSYKYDRA